MAMLLDQHCKKAGITSTGVMRTSIMRTSIMRTSIMRTSIMRAGIMRAGIMRTVIVRVESSETGSVRVIYIFAAATIFMMVRPVLIIAAVITACKDEYFASMRQQSGGA